MNDLHGWRALVRRSLVTFGVEIALARTGGEQNLYITAITDHGAETVLAERYADTPRSIATRGQQ